MQKYRNTEIQKYRNTMHGHGTDFGLNPEPEPGHVTDLGLSIEI